jgi:hypothetical protein
VGVETFDRNRLGWAVQPLLDAGLGLDEVRELVFRLAFEAVVTGTGGALPGRADALEGRSAELGRAWHRTLLRLALVDPLHDGGGVSHGVAPAGG